jgi:rhodanese-related sulfurtransferase
MNRSRWIIVAAVGLVAVVALAGLLSGGPDSGIITNAQFRSLQDDGVRIVDVRTAGEFGAVHLSGAENVPLGELSSTAAGWDRSQPIVVYCAVGDRSDIAADLLQSMGFETVYDLATGIARWDGEIVSGTQVAAATEPAMSGLPVMYEFYTDW